MKPSDADKKEIWRKVYEFVATLDSHGFEMMNYGYQVPEDRRDEADAEQFPHQMYRRVAGQADLRGKSVLEIGCGRGGGAAYIKRELGPDRLCGLDYSARAVDICRERHGRIAGLEFQCGDAEHLPFGADEFDAVVNIESSHCYASRPAFYRETGRVLKPGGDFLYADFFDADDDARGALAEAGFEIVAADDITEGVLRSLERDHERKAKLFEHLPQPRRGYLENWAGLIGSPMHDAFKTRKYVYLAFHLRKPGAP